MSNSDSQTEDSLSDKAVTAFIIILGSTTSGTTFRPSDWSDRLHGTLQSLKDDDCYEDIKDMVRLVNYDNYKCIMVETELKNINSLVYNFFINFAKNNKLNLLELSEEEWEQYHS